MKAPELAGPNHALLVGEVLGALLGKVDVEPELGPKGATGRLLVRRKSGLWALDIHPLEGEES